jgi:hypothetical protein
MRRRLDMLMPEALLTAYYQEQGAVPAGIAALRGGWKPSEEL